MTTLVFVRLSLCVALFPTWGIGTPVDISDPQTWFLTEDITTALNKTDGKSSPVTFSPYLPTDASHASALTVIPSSSSTKPSLPETIPRVGLSVDVLSPSTSITPSTSSAISQDTSLYAISNSIQGKSTPSSSLSMSISTGNSLPISMPTSTPNSQDKSSSIPTDPPKSSVVIVSCSSTSSISSPPPTPKTPSSVRDIILDTSGSRQRQSTIEEPTIFIGNRERPSKQRSTNKPFRGLASSNRAQNVPKDSCDVCTNTCSKNSPICTKPVGADDDADKLRGFPSTCHMDCFNKCRKIRYEKVADGRCGRLKDRIRPLGSKKKLNRTELNKQQYQVDSAEEPLFVFSNLF